MHQPRAAADPDSCLPFSQLQPTCAAHFNRAAFLAKLTGAVRHSGLRRFGTDACAAVQAVVADLAAQAAELERPTAGAGSGVVRPWPWPGQPAPAASASHSLVLLTDGLADDAPTMLEATAALLRSPPFPRGGFRALLVRGTGAVVVCPNCGRMGHGAAATAARAAVCLQGNPPY